MTLCLSVKLEAKENRPLINNYRIGDANVLINNVNSVRITPGDSLDDIYRDNVARRLNSELEEKKKRETISRESPRLRISSEVEEIGESSLSCVPYAWSQGMVTSGYGMAKNYPVYETLAPFVSTFEGNMGHIAVVEQDLGDSLVVRDANYLTGKITRRIISKSIVRGYLN